MNAQVSKSILIGFGFSLFCGLAEAEPPQVQRADRILADFEGADYGDWVASGDAFGHAPALGLLPGQQPVSGFEGQGLVNTFLQADQSTGTLTSPQFTLDRNFLNVLIGGGNHPGQTGLELLVDGQVVAALSGRNNETLSPQSIALAKWLGRPAHLRIIDHLKSGWGHINVDQIVLSDRKKTVAANSKAELVSLEKVWGVEQSGQPFNAFTDMIRYKGEWYLGCREAIKHHGGLAGQGRLRILRSADGEQWATCGLFILEEGDLRDAKLSITRDNELMLNSAIQVYHPNPVKHKNFAWFTSDGETWSDPVQIGEDDIWIWSVTWHAGVAYGVGYPTTPAGIALTEGKTTLYRSEDGRHWEVLVRSFYAGNESAIAFKADGTAVCLMRRGNAVGQAQPPYTQWSWQGTINVGGPDMIRLPDGRFIVGGRGGWGSMKLFELDPDSGKTVHLLDLPARGDSSYPGLVWHEDMLWVSYYTSSDDAKDGGRYLVPTEVRLAKVKLLSPPLLSDSVAASALLQITTQR